MNYDESLGRPILEAISAEGTWIKPDVLASADVNTSTDATVGTIPLSSIDDVSVVIPKEAYPCDIRISISKINNPIASDSPCLGAYDFGPSNIEFTGSVTVTIPYNATESATGVYWYNSLIDDFSQQGITDIETIISELDPTVHALRFNTTHFTPFYIFLGTATTSAAASGGGGGGGGCSMSPDSQASVMELLLPYTGLAAVMIVLKLKDKRKRKTRTTT